jgi:hypothetical protein
MSHLDDLIRRVDTAPLSKLESVRLTPVMLTDQPAGPEIGVAKVMDGTVVSFAAEVSPQHQEDAMQSNAFAHAAARAQHNPKTEREAYFAKYVDWLATLGWVIQGESTKSYSGSGTTFTMSKAVIDILSALATQNELMLVQASLRALESLADNDGRIRLFEKSAQVTDEGAFQLGVATETNGLMSLKLGAFQLNSSQRTTRVLFFGYSSTSTSLFYRVNSMTLSNELYAMMRQRVKFRLVENGLASIDEVKLFRPV